MTSARSTFGLRGVRVLELGSYEVVQLAGRTLVQLGAEVTKVEPGHGDPLRRRPPLVEGEDGVPRSLAFEAINLGKVTSEVPLDGDDRGPLDALVAAADVVLAADDVARELGLSERPAPAGQVRAIVGPYGADPAEPAPSSAFTRYHGAVSGYLVPGDKDLSVRPAWSGEYCFESMHATALVLAILAERLGRGGGTIDFSMQAYGLWLDKMAVPRVLSGQIRDLDRAGNAYPYGGSVRCADGYVTIFMIEEHQWHSLCRLVGRTEWIDEPRMATGLDRIACQDEIDDTIKAWAAERSVADVIARARLEDLPVGIIRTLPQVLDFHRQRDRGFLRAEVTPFGRVELAGLPFDYAVDPPIAIDEPLADAAQGTR